MAKARSNYPGVDFEFNGKKYWYFECVGLRGGESMLSEYYAPFSHMQVPCYPFGNTQPGLGKIKAWLKKQ